VTGLLAVKTRQYIALEASKVVRTCLHFSPVPVTDFPPRSEPLQSMTISSKHRNYTNSLATASSSL
jgi:hypothetical protein